MGKAVGEVTGYRRDHYKHSGVNMVFMFKAGVWNLSIWKCLQVPWQPTTRAEVLTVGYRAFKEMIGTNRTA